MKDFTAVLLALGRGIIKILISAVVGFGVGILLLGIMTAGRPELWERRTPPGELLIGIGSGMLSGGITLLLLFLIPWLKRPQPAPAPMMLDDEPIRARPAARPPRLVRQEADAAPPPSVVLTPAVVLPTATPLPPDEQGNAGFYVK